MQRTTSHASDKQASQQLMAQWSVRRAIGYRVFCWPVSILGIASLLGLAGCGTNLEEILFQSGAAISRTYVDLLLTDMANTLADQLDQEDEAVDEDQNGDDGDDGDGGSTDGNFDDLTGDPAAGEPLYASCAACHCADATGNCLPGAGALIGVSAETLDEFLRGDAGHPPSELTDQEIVDLEAYLASLGG